eukprot:6488514-Amphidinium_carterae.3
MQGHHALRLGHDANRINNLTGQVVHLEREREMHMRLARLLCKDSMRKMMSMAVCKTAANRALSSLAHTHTT